MRQEFYESKSILLSLVVGVFIAIGWGVYILSSCPARQMSIALFGAMVIFFLGKRYLAAAKPYVIIDDLKIEHDSQYILWSQVQKVSLTPKKYRKGLNLFLRVEADSDELWIDLKYVSDKGRRALLDAVDMHKQVQYVRCKYASNAQAWYLGCMVFIFVFALLALWFHDYITSLPK